MRAIACFLLTFALLGCSTPAPQASSDAERKDVLAATDQWRMAYDSRDPARIAALYAEGATFWGTTMKTLATSQQSIWEYFKDAASRPDARVLFTEQQIRIYGDIAINSGAYTFTDKRDGKDIVNPSRYSMVFHRRSGAWVLVHHHSSRLP